MSTGCDHSKGFRSFLTKLAAVGYCCHFLPGKDTLFVFRIEQELLARIVSEMNQPVPDPTTMTRPQATPESSTISEPEDEDADMLGELENWHMVTLICSTINAFKFIDLYAKLCLHSVFCGPCFTCPETRAPKTGCSRRLSKALLTLLLQPCCAFQ